MLDDHTLDVFDLFGVEYEPAAPTTKTITLPEVEGGGVYVIWLSDTHYYGGRAKSFRGRWRRHLRHLRRGDHYNAHMQAVFNQHGRFEPEVIAVCPLGEQESIEQAWLDEHYGKTGCMNKNPFTHGGNGPHTEETKAKLRGLRHTEETKAKLRAAQRRRFASGGLSEETKAKMSASQKARFKASGGLSESHKANISEAQKGRVFSEAHREKLREAWARRKAAGIETRCLPKKKNPPNTDEIVAFVKAGGAIRTANRRFFDDGRDHRDLIRRLVAEAEG